MILKCVISSLIIGGSKWCCWIAEQENWTWPREHVCKAGEVNNV